jgi:hypothetical protein
VNSPTTVAYPGAEEARGTIVDLSDGGTSLRGGGNLPPAGKVYFQFALPGQPQPVRLSGEVAWQDAAGRTGIRFVDVPQTSRRLMHAWLLQNSFRQTKDKDAPPPPPIPPKTVERYHEQAAYLHQDLLAMPIAEIRSLHLNREWARLLNCGGHTRKDRTPRPMATARFPDAYIAVSSDGQWCAYASVASGRSEVYVQRFPLGGERLAVSHGGASSPRWSRDGRALYFWDQRGRLEVASIASRPSLAVTGARVIETEVTPGGTGPGRSNYTFDVAGDGRILLAEEVRGAFDLILVRNGMPSVGRGQR